MCRSRPVEEAREIGAEYAKKLGCRANDMKCLRRVPVRKLILHMPVSLHNKERFLADLLLFAPVVDHKEVADQPLALFAAGEYHREVDILIGANKDEAGLISAALETVFKLLPIGRNRKP